VSVTGPTPGIEDEPSIAIDPTDPSYVIVGVQRLAGPCTYYESSDGGATWSHALIAPLTPGAGICYDIVARASPDGRFFYLSYLSIANESTDDVAILRISTDFGTVQGPFVAIPQRTGLIDKDWIDVHGLDSEHPSEVLLTATHFHEPQDCTVLFTRSNDYGKHWSNPSILATYPGCTERDIGGLGARPLGGLGSNVLVCWYSDGSDGWGPGQGGGGEFDIVCRTSLDDGLTFQPLVYAVKGEREELPYYTCPDARYQRIWSAMLPAMAIAPDGSAHLTYARDPTISNRDGECGDLRYIRGAGAPYDEWTAPVTIAGGSSAESFSAVAATAGQGGQCRLDVAYVDGVGKRPNRRYVVDRLVSTDCGATWRSPERVSDKSSKADEEFIGDYIDFAFGGGSVHLVWTDRRTARHVSDQGSDVYTDRWAT
jgi:hypothetical protein